MTALRLALVEEATVVASAAALVEAEAAQVPSVTGAVRSAILRVHALRRLEARAQAGMVAAEEEEEEGTAVEALVVEDSSGLATPAVA